MSTNLDLNDFCQLGRIFLLWRRITSIKRHAFVYLLNEVQPTRCEGLLCTWLRKLSYGKEENSSQKRVDCILNPLLGSTIEKYRNQLVENWRCNPANTQYDEQDCLPCTRHARVVFSVNLVIWGMFSCPRCPLKHRYPYLQVEFRIGMVIPLISPHLYR